MEKAIEVSKENQKDGIQFSLERIARKYEVDKKALRSRVQGKLKQDRQVAPNRKRANKRARSEGEQLSVTLDFCVLVIIICVTVDRRRTDVDTHVDKKSEKQKGGRKGKNVAAIVLFTNAKENKSLHSEENYK